jgi:hypothetical protein
MSKTYNIGEDIKLMNLTPFAYDIIMSIATLFARNVLNGDAEKCEPYMGKVSQLFYYIAFYSIKYEEIAFSYTTRNEDELNKAVALASADMYKYASDTIRYALAQVARDQAVSNFYFEQMAASVPIIDGHLKKIRSALTNSDPNL